MNPRLLALAVGMALFLPGCASVPRDSVALAEYKANNDPLEPLNRKTFAFNQVVDRILIKPVAKAYRRVIPEVGRDALRNAIMNLGEPLVFGNAVLQGRWWSAGVTADRVLLNTTVGLGGLIDFAKHRGLPQQLGDFGQTLHAWGFGEGPYLVIPVIGPSNPRDLVGFFAGIYGDPVRYVANANDYSTAFSTGRAYVGGIDLRARNIDSLDELERESIDYYAALRSLVRQKRAGELGTGRPGEAPQPPNFYDDPGAAAAGEQAPTAPVSR